MSRWRKSSCASGLEKSLRAMAQLVTGEERIRLVDEANAVRPRTLV